MFVTSKRRSCSERPAVHRGMVAVREMLLLAMVGGVLLLGGSWMMRLVTMDIESQASASVSSTERTVSKLSVTGDGQKLWVFRPYEGVVLKNIQTGDIEDSLPLDGVELSAVVHSRDSQTSLLCAYDGTMFLYRENRVLLSSEPTGSKSRVVGAAVSMDGNTAICLGTDGTIRGWIIRGSNPETLTSSLSATFEPLKFCMDPAGKQIFVGFADGSAAIYDVASGQRLREFAEPPGECAAAAWSDDGRFLAIGNSVGTISLHDAVTTNCQWRTIVSGRPMTIALSPDGSQLASSTQISKSINIWKLHESSVPFTLTGHCGLVCALSYSPDSQRLYSGSFDGTICEWSVASRRLCKTID
jgi:WD40 repeat protein